MNLDEALALTQDRLAQEGDTMGELLGHFRNRISPVLIGDREWDRILECAGKLPITMGALPFGFELPLHSPGPLSGERNPIGGVLPRARTDRQDG